MTALVPNLGAFLIVVVMGVVLFAVDTLGRKGRR